MERHGFVTFWLVLLIVSNAIYGGIYFFSPNTAGITAYIYLGVLSMAAVAASVLLLCWKKIGFWLFLGIQIICVPLVISIGVNRVQGVIGFLSVIILWRVLHINKNGYSTWDYLTNKNINKKTSSEETSQKQEYKPLFTPVSGDTWVCKKCNEINSSTSSSCKGCGEYR